VRLIRGTCGLPPLTKGILIATSMKIAYLVFAYSNPQLLRREIEALSSVDSAFFVHIDRKSNLQEFSGIKGNNVFFLNDRVTVYWAEFSGVKAITKLILHGIKAEQKFDYFVLLSGSEYPLRSVEYIHKFFEANNGQEFMDVVKIPNLQAGKPLSHINSFRVPSSKPALQLIVKALSRMGVVRRDYRKHFGDLAPYGGHTWWALTRGACEYIIEFIDQHPKLVRYFEYAAQPEETFFHTILGNSSFKLRFRRNLLYEDWSAGGRRPAMISEKHLAIFAAQKQVWLGDVFGAGEVLFARKYSDENLGTVDEVDKLVKTKGDF